MALKGQLMRAHHASLASVLSLVLLSACGINVEYIPMNTPPHATQPRTPAQVEMFSGSRPDRPFVEIGSIEVQQEKYNNASGAELTAKVREVAAQQGCDGIIVLGANDSTDVSGTM